MSPDSDRSGRGPAVPLSVLDLVPISSGSNPAEAVTNTIDLARQCERFGYHRYWFAEHHLNPGVAGTSPPVMIALVAARTSTIRLGSGAVQLGHRTPLSVVEEFGLIDALYPDRLDLGIGRSSTRRPRPDAGPSADGAPAEAGSPGGGSPGGGPTGGAPLDDGSGVPADPASPPPERPARPPRVAAVTPNGLKIPAPFSLKGLLRSPRVKLQRGLLTHPGAQPPDYDDQVAEIVALLEGTYCSADGIDAHVIPGERARVQLWILGSSAGVSAREAGSRGLRFAANYHITPSTVLEAVEAYRSAFRPSADLAAPHVMVSADVVVGATEEEAHELAAGYGLWVRSIRSGEGAIPFPTAAEARAQAWTEDDADLVADRIQTQFVGSPGQVADQLAILRDATDADELIVTTITHDHAARVRSFELLAREWYGTDRATAGPA